MAADVHANAPFSAQEFGTHLAVQSQTLAKLMETKIGAPGAPNTQIWGSGRLQKSLKLDMSGLKAPGGPPLGVPDDQKSPGGPPPWPQKHSFGSQNWPPRRLPGAPGTYSDRALDLNNSFL